MNKLEVFALEIGVGSFSLSSSPLMAHIADTLAQFFLRPVTPAPVEVKPTSNTMKSQVKVMPQKTKGTSKALKRGQARVDTHLGTKVVAPPDFTTRATAVLNLSLIHI